MTRFLSWTLVSALLLLIACETADDRPRCWIKDSDLDGYATPYGRRPIRPDCYCANPTPSGPDDVDCDDDDPAVHPNAAEVDGNGVDDDCDGVAR